MIACATSEIILYVIAIFALMGIIVWLARKLDQERQR